MNNLPRRKAEVISIDGHDQISTGQLNVDLVADYIEREGVNDWVAISAVAKFTYRRAFQANNKRVRARVGAIRRALLKRGHLLIAEGRPMEYVKIYVPGSEAEKQVAVALLLKMRKSRDYTAEAVEVAQHIIDKQVPAKE